MAPSRTRPSLALAAALLVAGPASGALALRIIGPEPNHLQILQSAGIAPTPQAIADFLRRETRPPAPEAPPPASDEKTIRDLIGRLGDDDYNVREEASDALLRIGSPALPLLREAVKSGDPEIRSRAQGLVEQIEGPKITNRGQLHDAALYVLLTTSGGAVDEEAGRAVVEFWPRFQGSPQGKTWMVNYVGQAAVQRGEEIDAEKLSMLDRLISVLEEPRAPGSNPQFAVQWLVQATRQNFGLDAKAWRRWYVARGGKEPPPPPEVIPDGAIVFNLGLKTGPRTPTLEVAGRDAASWQEAARILREEAERRRREGKAPLVLVRHPPAIDTSSVTALYAACKEAGIDSIQLRPIRREDKR